MTRTAQIFPGGGIEPSWVGEKVIIKSTSTLLWLIPVPLENKYFTVTADKGTKVQVNNYTTVDIDKSELEFYKP